MSWQKQYTDKLITIEEASDLVNSGDRVVISMMVDEEMAVH